jgi:hypothetical protein
VIAENDLADAVALLEELLGELETALGLSK